MNIRFVNPYCIGFPSVAFELYQTCGLPQLDLGSFPVNGQT